jgi:hypothetical protein
VPIFLTTGSGALCVQQLVYHGLRPILRTPSYVNKSIPILQTQQITKLIKDIYIPYFTLLPTLHPPTDSFIFVLIHRNAYIVSKILNPTNTNCNILRFSVFEKWEISKT